MKLRSHVLALLCLTIASLPAFAGTIVGTVVRKDTKRPETGIRVQLTDSQKDTRTDRQGRFEFLEVPAGPHPLLVNIDGFEPWNQNIEVPFSDTVRVQVEMTPLPAPGILTGRVTSGGGAKRVPHAHVQLQTLAFDIQADDDGAYWMYGIRPGTYRVKAVALGYDPVYTTARLESGRSTIASVDLGAPLSLSARGSASPAAAADTLPVDSIPEIRFTVPTDTVPPDPTDLARKRLVKVEILDGNKRVLCTLVDQELFPGNYLAHWNGTRAGAPRLGAGSYPYRIQIERRPPIEGDIVLP